MSFLLHITKLTQYLSTVRKNRPTSTAFTIYVPSATVPMLSDPLVDSENLICISVIYNLCSVIKCLHVSYCPHSRKSTAVTICVLAAAPMSSVQ